MKRHEPYLVMLIESDLVHSAKRSLEMLAEKLEVCPTPINQDPALLLGWILARRYPLHFEKRTRLGLSHEFLGFSMRGQGRGENHQTLAGIKRFSGAVFGERVTVIEGDTRLSTQEGLGWVAAYLGLSH